MQFHNREVIKMKTNLICSMVAISAVSLSASAEEGFSWGDVTFQPRHMLDMLTIRLNQEKEPSLQDLRQFRES